MEFMNQSSWRNNWPPSWKWDGSASSLTSVAGYPKSSLHPNPTKSTSRTSWTSFGDCVSTTVASMLSPSPTASPFPGVIKPLTTLPLEPVTSSGSVLMPSQASTRLLSATLIERSSALLDPMISSTHSMSCPLDLSMALPATAPSCSS